MIVTKCNGCFKQLARERNLVNEEQKLRRMLPERTFRPGLHCAKNRERTGVSLVCLEQLTTCTLVTRYAGCRGDRV